MRLRQAVVASAAAVLVAGLGAACSEPPPPGASDLVDPGTPAPKPSPTPSLPAGPLSGQPLAQPAVAGRQAIAVPIRATATGTPVGLDVADVVYQEFAESGSLHLSAVYQSRDAAKIGPVTEVRPVDIRSVGVLHPWLGYAGGPTGFVNQLAAADLTGVTPAERGAAFPSGYTSTTALRAAAPKGGTAPAPLFDYATPGTPLGTEGVTPAGKLTITAAGHATQTWSYDQASGQWVGQVGKAKVKAASVIVLTMEYRTLTVRKPSPRSLPSAMVYGKGKAVVVSGPSSARAAWSKPGQKLVCNVTDPAGYQIRPQPGTAWVIYAPTTARVAVT
ncbi:Protein of unknown function [Micromonospora rhizosphaerae]|uniref:DUF3048 domain-containing protein n=1 Tax=Micromonospora rhizosphaerae TaxID=568872 RepID=A0A1C6REP1_9ACTN|nr:DUF3048 domain-containing protein [Micromonospora rhizosphaerae]SCL15436.1 Protein of unknown function [Micromonospora rhizosphaerae]